MADIVDRAQKASEAWLEDALAAREAAAAKATAESAKYCRECERAIPEVRRQAVPGCQLCRDCQEDLEI